ncbi:MAG: alpha-E domain-containing protein [Thermomicrobiales bacterium]
MLSRIAESLYWIGRYVERAEDTARITDVTYHHTLGMGTSPDAERRRRRHWEALVAIVGDEAGFCVDWGEASEETVPLYLTFDQRNPNSIVSCVATAREQARTMRHQIASEMWEVLNRFHLDLLAMGAATMETLADENAHDFYRKVAEFSHLFQGVADSTMPREEGWHFLQAGKFLERAEKTARALDVRYHLLMADTDPGLPGRAAASRIDASLAEGSAPGDWHQWQAVLRSLSAFEAYHKLYRSAARPRNVIELLSLSPIFPRSIRFSIREVDAALSAIAATRATDPDRAGSLDTYRELLPAQRAAGRLDSRLGFGLVEDIFAAGLHESLLEIQQGCHQIGECIERQYFAHRVLMPEEVVA